MRDYKQEFENRVAFIKNILADNNNANFLLIFIISLLSFIQNNNITHENECQYAQNEKCRLG